MADTQFDNLHLSFVENVLPVGMALLNRAQKGGARKVIEGFTSSDDPVGRLKGEGSFSAQLVRDKLDQISPGLGNPIIEVKVSVENEEIKNIDSLVDDDLLDILNRIDDKIDAVQGYLDNPKDFN